MSKDSDVYLSFGVGLILGAGIGVILGVLFAPKSGDRLRNDLKGMADRLPDNVHQNIAETKKSYSGFVDSMRYTVEKQVSNVHDALKAGKMAADKKREELEENFTGY